MAARKRMPTDGGLVPAILSYLATQQDVIEAKRVNSGGKVQLASGTWTQLAPAGSFDISGYFRASPWPFPFEIEAKTTTGKLRESQLKRIAEILDPGNVPHCVARCVSDVVVFMGELRAIAAGIENQFKPSAAEKS